MPSMPSMPMLGLRAEVKTALSGVFEHLHLYVINSKSDEVLDYARYAKEESG